MGKLFIFDRNTWYHITVCEDSLKTTTQILMHNHIYQPRRWHKVNFFKRSLTGFNSEFSFSSTSFLTKAEEPSPSYYLRIDWGGIIGFVPFPRILVLSEMPSVSSSIWTRVVVSISYDDNHYTTATYVINV